MTFLCPGSGAESQILILSGISPSEEDLGTEPHRTTWTLGARRRLSLHAACPSLTWHDHPTCAVFPKLVSGGREGLASPKVFVAKGRRLRRGLLPKRTSPAGIDLGCERHG